jgi:cobalt/nickel transport system ATP-binding protein
MIQTVISLRGLTFSHDTTPLLDGIDFDLSAGERIGLTGANGSGKTTLLHLIVGLLKPTAGGITLFGRGRRSEAEFAEARRRIGFQFQDADDQLFCPTVAEDIAFGPLNLGLDREEIAAIVTQVLSVVGLEGFGERVTHHLSTGEKRLVSLATVLAMRPEVLLLDEPTAGLDEAAEARIRDILRGLPQAMIVIAHDRAFLADIGCRILRLEKGRLI